MTLTLAPTQSISGVAGTAAVVTYTVFGDDYTLAGGDAFGKLSQGQLGTSVTSLLTTASLHTAIVKAITFYNNHVANVTITLYCDGSGVAQKMYSAVLVAGGSATWTADGWAVYDASGVKQYVGGTGPTGARGLTWRGTYSAGTTYAIDDAVYYAATGQSYRSLIAGNVGNTPPATSDANWFQLVSKGDQGIQGIQGIQGVQGVQGDKGWSPIFAVVSNGSGGYVLQIVDWTGGAGTKPSTTNQFIGPSGIVGTAAAGQDIRGAQGIQGNPGVVTSVLGGAGLTETPTGGSAATVTLNIVAPGGALYADTDALYWGHQYGGAVVGASKAYAVGDRAKIFLRSNAGSAMTDSLPALTNALPDIGYEVKVMNLGTTVAETITFTALSGTFQSNNTATFVLRYGCRQTFIWSGTQWLFDAGTSNLLRFTSPAAVAGNYPVWADTDGRVVLDSGIAAGDATKIRGANVTTTAPTNGQVLQYVSASTAYIPFSYAGDVIGGPSAAVVQAIQGRVVSGVQPLPGQNLEYISAGYWSPSDEQFNIVSYGADPTNTADSTVAVYNAIVACATYRSPAQNTFTTAQQTCSGTFTISVQANTFPAGTNKIVAQTTLGGVEIQYTGGGGTTTLTGCTVTQGIAGGLLLSGSMIGFQNGYTQGGTVFCPVGLYKITQQIIVSFAGIQLLGPAASGPSDAPGVPFFMLGGPWFNWGGANGGIVIVGMPWTGATFPQLQGFAVRNLNISCQGAVGYGSAAGGILILSGTGFALENIMVYDPAQFAYGFDVLKAGSLATGTAHDCTRFTAKNLKFRCLEAAGAVAQLTNPAAVTNLNTLANSTVTLSGAPTAWPNTGNDLALFQAVDQTVGVVVEYLVKYTGISGSTLTGCTTLGLMPNESNSGAGPGYLPNALMFAGSTIRHASSINATGIRLHGSATANTCCAAFLQLTGQYGNGPAMSFLNCDSNIIYNPMFNRNGSGIGIDLHGSTLGAIGTCRNNAIYSGSAGAGGIRARGTGAGDLNYTFPSQDNYWYGMEVANGEPSPTIGLGATLFFSQNGTVNANPQLGTLTGDRLITGRMTVAQVIAGTTQATITGLNFPVIQPGVQYEFEGMVLANVAASASSVGGLMVSVSVPPGATLQCAMIGQTGAATSRTTFATTNSAMAIGPTTTALTGPVLVKGVVVAGTASSHTGVVQINAASASGSASTISNTATILAGSFLKAIKVG